MYIREAHPTDGRQVPANVRDKVLVEDPKTLEERRQVALEFAEQFKISLPILVDTLDDRVEKAYAGWPDRIYVIDPEGKIAYKGGPGPGGFRVAEARAALDRLVGPPGPAPPGAPAEPLPAEARERLLRMLTSLGFTEPESAAALNAATRKMGAYRALREARMALFQSVRQDGDAAAALATYHEARKRYTDEAEKIDRELDSQIRYTSKPRLHAGLTALGLLGSHPSPPLLGPSGNRGPVRRPQAGSF